AEAALAQILTGFPLLRIGSTGREVVELQQLLQSRGYFNFPINGYFDSRTQDALARFQQANGLPVTGQFDAATSALLGGGSSPGSPTIPLPARGFFQREDRGPAVTTLQQLLQTLGYFRTNPTGFYGPITEDAVRQFQGDRGLTQTGQVGRTTLSSLLGSSGSPGNMSPISPFLPSNAVLSFGDSGPEVGLVQQRLQELRFYFGPINSFFDGNTQQAVLRFQQANRITPTGQVGPTTKAFLFPGAGSSPLLQFPLRRGNRGFLVRQLQSFLNQLGYQAGSVDGVFGTTTELAVRRLQEDLRVIPTGAIDESTLLALRNNLALSQQGQNYLGVSQLSQSYLGASQVGFTQNYVGTSPVSYTARGSFPNNPSQMLQWQRRLNRQGLYFGPFDGVYNSQMQQAIARARQLYGISAAELLFRP
ncbi:MAG: hypothetical protein F6K35_44780, partial [Okeania sp. SIO2H7]|nr:hypothetical protein [Okeania sp. SIO2H7]